MAGRQEPGFLNQRKRALIAESDLNRLALRAELEQFQASMRWFDRAVEGAFRFGPWLVPLASVLGITAGRAIIRKKKRRSRVDFLVSAARWLPSALSLWRRFARRIKQPADERAQ